MTTEERLRKTLEDRGMFPDQAQAVMDLAKPKIAGDSKVRWDGPASDYPDPLYAVMGMTLDKVIVTVDRHGNTSAASVPLALDEAVRSGRITRGDNLLLEAFGGGLTWGSALVRY